MKAARKSYCSGNFQPGWPDVGFLMNLTWLGSSQRVSQLPTILTTLVNTQQGGRSLACTNSSGKNPPHLGRVQLALNIELGMEDSTLMPNFHSNAELAQFSNAVRSNLWFGCKQLGPGLSALAIIRQCLHGHDDGDAVEVPGGLALWAVPSFVPHSSPLTPAPCAVRKRSGRELVRSLTSGPKGPSRVACNRHGRGAVSKRL